MKRLVILITKPPHSDEGAERMCGVSKLATQKEKEVSIYLMGDGVLCAKRNQSGYVGTSIGDALRHGVEVYASKKDLYARGLSKERVEDKVTIVEDIEGHFLDDIMERSDKVISW